MTTKKTGGFQSTPSLMYMCVETTGAAARGTASPQVPLWLRVIIQDTVVDQEEIKEKSESQC